MTMKEKEVDSRTKSMLQAEEVPTLRVYIKGPQLQSGIGQEAVSTRSFFFLAMLFPSFPPTHAFISLEMITTG